MTYLTFLGISYIGWSVAVAAYLSWREIGRLSWRWSPHTIFEIGIGVLHILTDIWIHTFFSANQLSA